MGVEVYWLLIKALCSCISSLRVFLGHLCHFIKAALGEEHRKCLNDAGTPNAVIRRPVATKDMWDGMQDVHAKTLSGCFVIDGTQNADWNFRDLLIEVEESRDIGTPLCLKLVIYYENSIREGLDMPLDWSDTKTVLLPRQHPLKKLDPSGVLNVPPLREKLRPRVSEYERVVLKDVVPPGMDICQALKIYDYFHLICYMQEWTENEILVACSCKVCLTNCVCRCTFLFAAIFRSNVRVPDD